MARKRFIDPSMFADARFVGLKSDACRLFFIGSFTFADDFGRLFWSVRSLLGNVFPMDLEKLESDVRGYMQELEGAGLVHTYEHNGLTYAHFPKWAKYQNPSHPAASKLPSPPCCADEMKASGSPREILARDSGETPESLLKSSLLGMGMGMGMGMGRGSELALTSEINSFLALVAGENKTGTLARTRSLSLTRDLLGVLAEAKDPEAFLAGLREANGKGKPNVNYVRACVRSALERMGSEAIPKRRPASRYRDLTPR